MADISLDPGEYEAFYGVEAAPGERIAYNRLTGAYQSLGEARNLIDYYNTYGSVPGAGGGGGGSFSSGGEVSPQGYSVSEYFGGKDTDAYRKYQEGKREGKWRDLPDYIAQQSDPTKAILDTAQQQAKREKEFLDQYSEENPFIFDEELARQSSTAEYEPYYAELLDDHIAGIDLKRETIEDDRNLLNTLSQYDTAQRSREYTKAIRNAEEGFAGRGLFFSGIRKATTGEAEVGKVEQDELAAEKLGYRQRGLDRKETALDLDLAQTERDIGRDKEAAITGGIEQRRGEAIRQYNVPFQQAYTRQFGTGGDLLSGYLVPEYARF